MIEFRITLIAVLFLISAGSVLSQNHQNQWKNLNGPEGGSVLQFNQDGNRLYALTYGGIYQLDFSAAVWELLPGTRNMVDHFSSFEVEGNTLYILSGNGQIFRSLDMGNSWKTILQKPYPENAPGGQPRGFFVFGETVISISNLTIYRSVNQGNTWQSTVVPDDFYMQKFKSFAKVGGDLLVAFDGQILKSNDSGLTWVSNFKASYSFADMEAIDSILYAVYDGYPRLIRSGDHGQHWDKIDTDSIKFGQYNNETEDWITGVGSKIYYSSDYWCTHGGIQMFHSTNRGEDWFTSPRKGLRFHSLRDLKALPTGLFAGTMQGVFRSLDDAVSFQPFHAKMNGAWTYDLFKMPAGRWWSSTRQGIFSSDDGGKSWNLQFPGELEDPCGWWASRILHTQKRLFRIDYDFNTHILMSDDSGDTWAEIPPFTPFWSPNIYCSESALWLIEDSRLYKMSDATITLEEVLLPATGYLSNFQASGNKLCVYIASDRYISENQGSSWEKLSQQTPAGQQAGAIEYMDNDAIFALTLPFEDSILMFDFRKKTWQPFSPIIDGDTLHYWDYQFLKNFGGLRWISVTDKGLFYSATEAPEKWYAFEPRLPFNNVTALTYDTLSQELWVGTAGAGIYCTKFQTQHEASSSPKFGVYPNPSYGESTLYSETFFTGNIAIQVFDMAGKTWLNQSLPPGQSWNIGLDIPAGMYIWQIITPYGTSSIKWVKIN